MYHAELKGKLSHKTEGMEDILTSNVFSFFMYSDRETFLHPFIANILGLKDVSKEDAKKAEFFFWPTYADINYVNSPCQPDVVIIIGDYYLLFEAKYIGSTLSKEQLLLEKYWGENKADEISKSFLLVVITMDYSEPKGDYNKNYSKWRTLIIPLYLCEA